MIVFCQHCSRSLKKKQLRRHQLHHCPELKKQGKTKPRVYKDRIDKPYLRLLEYAKRRCTDTKHRCYPSYGGRGITVTLTRAEVEALWERDKGWLLDRPSLDRKEADKNYSFDNCRFIEYEENAKSRYQKECEQPEDWGD